MRQALLISLAAALLAGCQTPTPADPNDPKLGAIEPEVLRRSLKGASEAFMDRVTRGEISDGQFQDLMAQTANRLLTGVTIENTDPEMAWEYGEVFRTARQWASAETFLRVAVDFAIKTRNEDRRVNDLVRLAQVLVMENKVEEGLKTARETFSAPDEGCAPILPATLLEIAPAARGKGHDLELAELLVGAIACHRRTRVDTQSEAGRAFLSARPYHIRNAYRLAVGLLQSSGQSARAAEVLEEFRQWSNTISGA